MNLSNLLNNTRNHYLNLVSQELKSIDIDKKVIIEPALRDSEGSVITEGVFNSGSRIDIAIVGSESEQVNFDFDSMLSFDEISFTWETKLNVVLNSFEWDYCSIVFVGAVSNWALLENWFAKWFIEKPSDSSQFYNCVHFISDPESTELGSKVFVDFGSAEISALEELFDTALDMGVREIKIGGA